MLQEPKFMQYKNPSVYGIIVIQQAFLASVASFGIRLNSKKVTFPKSVFNEAIESLIAALQHCLTLLVEPTATAQTDYKTPIEQFNQSIKEIIDTHQNTDTSSPISMRETQFYGEQFNYLFGLVKNLEQAIRSINT